MSISTVKSIPLAQDVKCSEDELIVSLIDGRSISVPLSWFPKLSDASKEQLKNWEILGNGEGIHWPEIDEDISVEGLLVGVNKPIQSMEV